MNFVLKFRINVVSLQKQKYYVYLSNKLKIHNGLYRKCSYNG